MRFYAIFIVQEFDLTDLVPLWRIIKVVDAIGYDLPSQVNHAVLILLIVILRLALVHMERQLAAIGHN